MRILKAACVLLVFAAAMAIAVTSGLVADLGRSAMKIAGTDNYPTLVVPFGYRLKVGDRVGRIFDHDACPRDWMDNLRGMPTDTGCTVLDDKAAVSVTYEDGSKERLIVKRDGDRTSLIPVDGAGVVRPD